MTSMTWGSIAEQLRGVGVEVPLREPLLAKASGQAQPATGASPWVEQSDIRFNPSCSTNARTTWQYDRDPHALCGVIKMAIADGVTFFEGVVNGELIAEGLSHLAADTQQMLAATWHEISSELLPLGSTASGALVTNLGIDVIFIDDPLRAAHEVARLCESTQTIGLDIETAPRAEYLPLQWPIKITKDGQRAKIQNTMNTSAALDPFRAECVSSRWQLRSAAGS